MEVGENNYFYWLLLLEINREIFLKAKCIFYFFEYVTHVDRMEKDALNSCDVCPVTVKVRLV